MMKEKEPLEASKTKELFWNAMQKKITCQIPVSLPMMDIPG